MPVAQVNLVVLQRQRGRSAGQVRRRQPDGGDARRGRRHAVGARARRRGRLPRRRPDAPPAGIDSSAVRLHVPVARLADALPIMADVALRPTFPQDELERLRQQRLTALLQARDDPATIAAPAFARVLYGADHRYGTRDGRHRGDASRPFTAGRSARLLRGGIPAGRTRRCSSSATSTPDKALPLLEASFGGWKAPGPARAPVHAAGRSSTPATRDDLPRRQAGRAAVADPHRLDRRRRDRRRTTFRSR